MSLEVTSQGLKKRQKLISKTFNLLVEYFGRQNWWPAETPFEVIVGSILTHQTSWKNVEKAITRLKKNGLLDPKALFSLPIEKLAELIRETGFYRLKAQRLKNFLEFFKNYNFDLDKLKDKDIFSLREELLSVKGIGKETADSIILYALNKPIFVVDNYTKRFGMRLGILDEDISYDKVRDLFESSLKNKDINITLQTFKEMHALIVELGKNFCKNKPNCNNCPLNKDCLKKGVKNEYS
ncbi:MAG: endonuclease III domain-containing protein [Caldisericum exile]|uniref:endonuclease III domain-containing protein n=1 Tax=Caldisericum exile TaxID=693075 RepID=UPI003C78DAC5